LEGYPFSKLVKRTYRLGKVLGEETGSRTKPSILLVISTTTLMELRGTNVTDICYDNQNPQTGDISQPVARDPVGFYSAGGQELKYSEGVMQNTVTENE
jgi:hypothetical protein